VKDAADLIPWQTTDISVYPYGPEYWSMNPSIHLGADGIWRCVARIVDYSMPNGITVKSKKAPVAGHRTRNAMLHLDPKGWKVAEMFPMEELDGLPRVQTTNLGYEDMRLFTTDSGGFQGIAACLHLDRGDLDAGRPIGAPPFHPPEQVLLNFDRKYNIVKVKPIRGASFSGRPQKNWAPFDHAVDPRFMYAIDRGTMFDVNGAMDGLAVATPSASRSLVKESPAESEARVRRELEECAQREKASAEERERQAREREERERVEREAEAQRERQAKERREQEERERRNREKRDRERRPPTLGRSQYRGAEVKSIRGGALKIDTVSSRPSQLQRSPQHVNHHSLQKVNSGTGNSKVVSTGRSMAPRYAGLRGGSQLVHIGDGQWLGIGHDMNFLNGRKNYWHIFYLTDSYGKVQKTSEPMKLVKNGIEFAAGMAIDGDRVAVSFGVDDMNALIGETSLSAVLETLSPVG